ncbi:MAG: PEGA domain-containing protein [Myxococcales bacterium]|nr:PEGA domain-containing protein [Myxococcales bacterium]
MDFSERAPKSVAGDEVRLIVYDLPEGDRGLDEAKGFLKEHDTSGVPVFFLTHSLNQEQKIALLDFDGCNNLRVRDGVIDQSEFAADIKKILSGNIFGLDKYLPYGSEIKRIYVSNYAEKSNCIAQVSQYAARMKVRKPIRNAIEQVLDELLMNAIYDAPVDKDGQPLFANLPTELRVNVQLDTKKRVRVEFGCTNRYFAISVLDQYGSLRKKTILQYWKKCISEKNQIDQKPGGAGLGLYLVLNSVTGISINLRPSVATEMVCLFDLNYKTRDLPQSFQIHYEQASPDDTLLPTAGGGPGGKRSPGILYLLTSLLILIVAAAALFVTQFNKGSATSPNRGPTTEKRLPLSPLTISTDPPGARVSINGKAVTRVVGGKTVDVLTPTTVPNLRAGQDLSIALEKDGFVAVHRVVRLKPNKAGSVHVKLERRMVSVAVTTAPSGAEVIVDGRVRGTSPLRIEIPFGKRVKLAVSRIGFKTIRRDFDTGKGNFNLHLALPISPEFGSLVVTTVPPGATVKLDGKTLEGKTPLPKRLLKGEKTYQLSFEHDGYRPLTRMVSIPKGQVVTLAVKMVAVGGLSVQSNVEVLVFLNNRLLGKTPVIQPSLAAGTYRLRLLNKKLKIDYRDRIPFVVKSGEEINRKYEFEKVLIKAPANAVVSDRRSRNTYKNGETMYLLPGRQVLRVKMAPDQPERVVVHRVIPGRPNKIFLK